MYISGTKFNFEHRLHQTTNNYHIFTGYWAEGSGYMSGINLPILKKWNRELQHQYNIITGINTTGLFLHSGIV